MSEKSAYETKVMLEFVRGAIYEAISETEMLPITRKAITGLKDALYFVHQIQHKYDHIKCPQLGFSDEDYNEMQGADDNRP